MSKEFAFQQAGRNRGAIYFDQGALAALAQIVNRVGD